MEEQKPQAPEAQPELHFESQVRARQAINDFQFRTDIVHGQQQPDKGNSPSAGSVIEASLGNDWSLTALHKMINDREFDFDPRFDLQSSLEDPDIKARVDKLPDEAKVYLGNAHNAKHLKILLHRAEQEMENEQTLAKAGGWGIAARVAVGMADPVDWAVSIPIGGIGSALSKGHRIKQAITAGTSAASANAAVESTVAAVSPLRDERDVFLAAALGFGIAAPLGYLAKADQDALANLANKEHRTTIAPCE